MELRQRIIRALLGAAVVCVVTLLYSQDIVAWLATPLFHALRKAGLPAQVYAFRVTTGFGVYMWVGLIGGLVLAAPWVLYQIWRFVATGLYRSERKVVHILAPFSALMTLLGILFFYYILLPLALVFLVLFSLSYPTVEIDRPPWIERMVQVIPESWRNTMFFGGGGPRKIATAATAPAGPGGPVIIPVLRTEPATLYEGQIYVKLPENEVRLVREGQIAVLPLTSPTMLSPLIDIAEYINFVMLMGLAVTIAFQLPVLMMVIGWTGLIAPSAVARARRYCVFGCFVLAAVLTPTGDPFNMSLLAFPLWGLFELGLVVMRLAYRYGRGRREAEAADRAG